MTEPEPLQQVGRTYVRFRGRKLSYFSGCDYFRLASHPKILQAASAGMRRYGLNVAASRLTTGNHAVYRELEECLARFFGAQMALLVSSGYMTNLIAAQALAGEFSHALLDEKAHPSLRDSSRFLDCPVHTFKHQDGDDLTRVARKLGRKAKILLMTDGMFAHDGSTPPLKRYLEVLPTNAMILVDDAHAAGVLGRTGKGSPEHHGVSRRRIIQTLTLSKAFGVFGGAVIGNKRLRQNIIDRSQAIIGSTPLPLPLAMAAIESISILETDQSLRKRLIENSDYVKSHLREGGLELEDTPGPIVGLAFSTEAKIATLRRALLKEKVYPPFLRYPGGANKGFFRFAVSSEHSREQLDALTRAVISIL